ncbi:ABC transporter substrate-binding protein [Actinobacteria bacterium YIM 96077]|uniref:ABC transporter substrate-binding protein n=1 Tax=Phytoactinopolyspora halophila TaxID=1981511 RepID=A0A329QTC0_9ACTN|nr:ABC transporter substrate-binding protein [Phytoactinopolyspora halophila]AYY13786.1 ABC transporter substrate-binding protein [Actinobacteria bacterium YIM 96077]RAW15670.1 ABC transporter substrate-binding protein [Phytoactinopolyspora halophila]
MTTLSSTNRWSLLLALISACALLAAACSPGTGDDSAGALPDEEEAGDDAIAEGQSQAPELAEMVDNGELPPLEERLPDEPLVVDVVDRIGVYGGTWRRAESEVTELEVTERRHIGYERLFNWTPEWEGGKETTPNVATDVEVNDEGTEFTFSLREGMRWSDGEPFTADDIVFAVEDYYFNDDLRAEADPRHLDSGGPPEVEAVDDHTVRFTFDQPHGLFLQGVAEWATQKLTALPRHYLEQFHADYNDDNLDELVEESGLSSWVDLFLDKSDAMRNPDLPVIYAWQVTQPFGEGNDVVFERNPYYWKVDPEGNQLPYIDEHVVRLVEESEVIKLDAMNGELDFQRSVGDPADRALIMENAEQGDYRTVTMEPDHMNTMAIHLNQTTPDETKREIFQNKDFRIGLSHAIDRQEIIDVVYFGQGEPFQIAATSELFYNEELAKQYTEYDVDLANEYLDDAGYEMDEQGRRIGPDGEPISITVDYANDVNNSWTDALELVEGYWEEVGVDLELNGMSRSLHTERVRENGEHEATVWTGSGGLVPFMQTHWYFPSTAAADFASAWGDWYLNPDDPNAEEPPEGPRRQMELYDEILRTVDEDKQVELMRELLEILKDEFYSIGISTPPEGLGVVTNRMHNVPDHMYNSTSWPTPGPTNTIQYFIQE